MLSHVSDTASFLRGALNMLFSVLSVLKVNMGTAGRPFPTSSCRPGQCLLAMAFMWPSESKGWPSGLACADSSIPHQEIPLSEILAVESAQNFSLVPPGTNPHCFEIITANVTYFVGETPGGAPGAPSGQGTEAVRGWETAIRQALMPVILQDAPTAPGHEPHRKSLPRMLRDGSRKVRRYPGGKERGSLEDGSVGLGLGCGSVKPLPNLGPHL